MMIIRGIPGVQIIMGGFCCPFLSHVQGSLLRSTQRTSSTCTGAYTAEMALAVIQKTINDSKALPSEVTFQPISAFATWTYANIRVEGLGNISTLIRQ